MRNEAMRAALSILTASGLAACVEDYSPESSNIVQLDAGMERDAAMMQVPDANMAQGYASGCDLSGRWLMTEHRAIVVLGAHQTARSWFYVELAQQGEQVTMTKAMSCGQVTVSLAMFEATFADEGAWPAYMEKVRYDGRRGSSRAEANGCHVTFDRGVAVRGATVAKYRDLAVALPGSDERAVGDTAGWEDWDHDGNPGVTRWATGIVRGYAYEASRTTSSYDGLAPRDPGSFVLSNDWTHERALYGVEAAVLAFQDTPDPDETQQIVELTRLMPDQARGDDAATCQAIRELAPSLTPHASALHVPTP